MRSLSKTHSYGEYIFDWAWANAYAEHGLPYYPKLVSMVPFTPATAAHFLAPEEEWPQLLGHFESRLPQHSSAHFLFTTPAEQDFLREHDYLARDSFQYHFFNEDFATFDDFLARLKAKKAKHIRAERRFPELTIERLTGAELTVEHAQEMYGFYRQTTTEKEAIAYLTESFFELVFQQLPQHVLYVRASTPERAIAGAFFLYDTERLYGRYWGAHQYVENLHFELCYYQGIDFCLEKRLRVFEAGAQGEHKIARGFRPVRTYSSHKINHPGFARAIADFLERERRQISMTLEELTRLLPFKS